MKKTLVLQDGIYPEIVRLACEFKGLEFAITLFGSIRDERFDVTHFTPPGRNAEHAVAAAPMTMNLSPTSSIGYEKRFPAFSTSGICTRTLRRVPGSLVPITRR